MTSERQILPRSLAIPKSWKTLDFGSVFSAFIYPALGVIGLVTAIVAGLLMESVQLHWYYAPIVLAVIAVTVVVCNIGIGGLHRIWQHKAGDLRAPAQIIVMINVLLAMQGSIKDWINYHSQHHRFADKPGDPHNPFESKTWAWVGWIMFRDEKDLKRPMPLWIKNNVIVRICDRNYNLLASLMHFGIPAIIYLIVWAAGGDLVITLLIHAAVVIGRAMQFHATVLGINVFGHLQMPKWFTYTLALLTGGEAFHDHHHDEPVSILHLPKRGFWNRIFDYNGTFFLMCEKLRWAKDFQIAPRFLPAKVKS
ncbi:MAG: acyl-CoA desaturase [Ponticaulis sp.]|nr:acyl-CoA desaturase [Ponticaulis sp.]